MDSNLLDALRFLSEVAQSGAGGLQAAIQRRGGFTLLRSLFARSPSDIRLAVSIGNAAAPQRWKYLLRFKLQSGERFATVIEEAVTPEGGRAIKRSRKGGDPRDWSQTLLEQNSANRNFRELQEFLASCRYLHVVPQNVRDRRRAHVDEDDAFGGDLLRRMKDMPPKSREPRLARIADALKIAVPHFESLELVDDTEGVPHLQAKFKNWRARASRQAEGSLSDGTLRLFGLLWSMSERGGPLLLEEPELSLNEAVVSQVPRMLDKMQRLSGRQVVATTHSAALLEESGVGLAETYLISVDSEGSNIAPANSKRFVVEQVRGGLTVGQAVLPLVTPSEVERLGRLEIGD